jgi:hypothetical protein
MLALTLGPGPAPGAFERFRTLGETFGTQPFTAAAPKPPRTTPGAFGAARSKVIQDP